MQAYRSRDASQFASNVPKETDCLPPSGLGYPPRALRAAGYAWLYLPGR